MSPQPLSEAEFDSLSEALERLGAMNLEQLDGFLASLVCGPEEVSNKSECLQEVCGFDVMNHAEAASEPTTRTLLALLSRHRDSIAHTLRSGDVFTPLLVADEQGEYPANDWAKGFLRGMERRRGAWASLVNDEEHGGSLVPIFVLAHEHDPDPEMRPYKEPIPAELRERLIIDAAAAVMNIFRYFKAGSTASELSIFDSLTHRHSEPKVGRNEPCPCGSGKKYKLCCGRVTFH